MINLPTYKYDAFISYYQDIVQDAHGNDASLIYRNAAGESVSLPDGTFRKVYVYDEKGKGRCRTECYDKDGALLRVEKADEKW